METIDQEAKNGTTKLQLLKKRIQQAPIQDIRVDQIQVADFCKRDDYDGLDHLVESIRKFGLLSPVGVVRTASGYRLIFGSRRYMSHKHLQAESIRAHVLDVSEQEASVLSLVENSTIKQLDPVARAEKLEMTKELLGLKKDGELAEQLGLKQSTVSEYLAILKLESDIREGIDTRPESPFKYTHAVILSRMLSGKGCRVNAKFEVRQLYNKTLKFSLPVSELKALVHIFEKGPFERLPDQLRSFLLTKEAMTSHLARLYLNPEEELFDHQSQSNEPQRAVAASLNKKWLGNFIYKAVNAGWSFAKTRKRLLKNIEDNLKEQIDNGDESEVNHRKLLEAISNTRHYLEVCNSEVEVTSVTKSKKMEFIRSELVYMQKRIEEFLTNINVTADHKDENSKGKGKEDDSVT